MKRKKFILVFLSVCLLASGQHQQNGFYKLTIDNGLSHNEARCVVQDSIGFIYIGTTSGLQRYDGYEFVALIPPSSAELSPKSKEANKLTIHNNKLWILNSYSLQCFDLILGQYLKVENDTLFKGSRVRQREKRIVFDSYNRMWFRFDNSLEVYELGLTGETVSLHRVTQSINLPKIPQISGFESDGENRIWLGTDEGFWQGTLLSKDSLVWNFYTNPNSNIISYQKSTNTIWVTSFQFVRYFTADAPGPNRVSKLHYNPHIGIRQYLDYQPGYINHSAIDHSEGWLALGEYGLLQIRNMTVEKPLVDYYNTTNTNFKSGITSVSYVYPDCFGSVWLASWAEGVAVLDRNHKQFQTIQIHENYGGGDVGLANINRLACDTKGRIWMSSVNNHLFIYNGDEIKQIKAFAHSGLPIEGVFTALYIDSKDRLYLGSNNGLYIHHIKTDFTQLLTKEDSVPHRITSLTVDKNDVIWALVHADGLYRIDVRNKMQKSILKYNHNSSDGLSIIPLNLNKIVYNTNTNEILFTGQNGLNRGILDKDGKLDRIISYRLFKNADQRQYFNFWDITIESDTTCWIATLGGGLIWVSYSASYQSDYFQKRVYTASDGLPDNHIHTVILDQNKHVWIASKGLSHLDPVTGECWNYSIGDGLQSNGFNTSAALMSNGRLFFGGINGVNFFSADSIKLNTVAPHIALTRLIVNGHEVLVNDGRQPILKRALHLTDKIVLQHRQNNFSIEFAALHYANPRKHKYRYKLEGFDHDWVFTNSQFRKASYLNLNYGTYQFVVNGTNNDGVWSKHPAKLTIRINPPWWWTFIAKVLYVFVFAGVLIFIYYVQRVYYKTKHELRIKNLNETKNEEILQTKLRFFTNISHELKTPLSLIQLPAEQLIGNLNMPLKLRSHYYKIIDKNAKHILRLVTELLEFRKAEMGKFHLKLITTNLNQFISEIANGFQELMNSKKISFEWKMPLEDICVPLDQDKFLKIVSNLLTNAYKYTNRSGKIELLLTQRFAFEDKMYQHSYLIDSACSTCDFVYLIIRDTGIGISPSTISQIFERFYQVEESDQEKHLGSGIGLALTKSLLKLHQCSIMVNSERYKGTEFVIGVPLTMAAYQHLENVEYSEDSGAATIPEIWNASALITHLAPDEPTLDKFEQALSDEKLSTLLIVEDNDELRTLLTQSFSAKYWVLAANTGAEALNIIRSEYVDLIISDVMMPEMTGIELCQKVKNSPELCHLPIILLTAKSEVEDKIVGVDAGAEAYISKPFSFAYLSGIVRNIIHSRQVLKERYKQNVFATPDAVVTNTKDEEFLNKVVHIIIDNISNPDFRLPRLLSKIGMSRTPFYNKIKLLTGQAPAEFIRTIKLKHAAKLLLLDDKDINQVSMDLGFKHQSHFTRQFKDEFACTPTEFIQRNKG